MQHQDLEKDDGGAIQDLEFLNPDNDLTKAEIRRETKEMIESLMIKPKKVEYPDDVVDLFVLYKHELENKKFRQVVEDENKLELVIRLLLLWKDRDKKEVLTESEHLKKLQKIIPSKHVTIFHWLDFRQGKLKMRHLDDISDGLPPDYIKRLEDIEQEIDAKIALEEVKSGVKRFDDSVPNTSGKKKSQRK